MDTTEKKFELTMSIFIVCTLTHEAVTVYQIRALRDFGDVKKGDLGGWVASEDNLSHEGECWLYDNACVYNSAWVSDNAKMYGYSRACLNAWVSGNAKMFDLSIISHSAMLSGHAQLCDFGVLEGHAYARGNAFICGNGKADGNARINGSEVIGQPGLYQTAATRV